MAQAARDLGLSVNVLRRWVQAFRTDPQHAFPGEGHQKSDQAEFTRLRQEVAKLRMEREILKKNRGLLRQGVDVTFGFGAKHRAIWPIS